MLAYSLALVYKRQNGASAAAFFLNIPGISQCSKKHCAVYLTKQRNQSGCHSNDMALGGNSNALKLCTLVTPVGFATPLVLSAVEAKTKFS